MDETLKRLEDNLGKVLRGQRESVRKLLAAFAAGGHVLLEDYPGTGKTTMAKALAHSVGARFRRAQFTPDLLPSDLIGVSIYDQKEQSFRFHEGPVFTDILLADEINRASPRTQSALLEAMAEGQVSADGKTLPLPGMFFVIATQNPIESHGTYPLPEAQMDRFMMRFGLGYVSPREEAAILCDQERAHPLDGLKPCIDSAQVSALRERAAGVRFSDELKRYAVELVGATRRAEGVALGASPRASLALMRAARALALLDGADFVSPEQVRELAVAVLAHRLVLDPQARFAGATARAAVEAVLKSVPAPA
ncbi:MAG: AAA family ATPase [Elusimicrobia bacterium]|nr:AAA family ATPase [Elusimicrobiota bacterium]